MALHLTIGPFKNPALGWSRFRDANPVLNSLLADDFSQCAIMDRCYCYGFCFGCWLSVVGCWLSVVGYCWLLVIVGCWLLVIVGCWLLVVVGFRLLVFKQCSTSIV